MSMGLWCARLVAARAGALLWATLLVAGAVAQPQEPRREVFAPSGERGAIVVVVSGASGARAYRDFSAQMAAIGYYTVLMEGKDVFDVFEPRSDRGESNLAKVIAESQSAPQALPGKVALVGFSLGGAGVLLRSGPLGERISAVVGYYPAINRLVIEEADLAARLKAPTLVLAAGKDEQDNCCKIESMRALESAPKTAPFELVVYPEAGHGFNLQLPPFVHRAADADDALARTATFLTKLHPARGP